MVRISKTKKQATKEAEIKKVVYSAGPVMPVAYIIAAKDFLENSKNYKEIVKNSNYNFENNIARISAELTNLHSALYSENSKICKMLLESEDIFKSAVLYKQEQLIEKCITKLENTDEKAVGKADYEKAVQSIYNSLKAFADKNDSAKIYNKGSRMYAMRIIRLTQKEEAPQKEQTK